MGFCYLGGGECPKVNQPDPGLGLFLMPPGREEAQGHLPRFFTLTCFSCWSLRIEVTNGRGLSKGQGRKSRAAGNRLNKELKKIPKLYPGAVGGTSVG